MLRPKLMIGTLLIVYGISLGLYNNKLINISLTFIIIGLLFFLYTFIQNKIGKVFKKAIFILICIGLLVFITTETFIIGVPKINKNNTDYILVIATNLEDSSGCLSKTLKNRLDLVVDSIFKDANDSKVIVSGGKVNEDITEADLMERYLIDQGIPKSKILKEASSENLEENLLNAEKIMRENYEGKIEDASIKIITTNCSALNSRLVAERYGYNNFILNTSNTSVFLVPAFYLQESYLVLKNLIISSKFH